MLWTYFFDSSQFTLNFPQRERRPPGKLFRRFTSHHNWSSLFSVSVIIVIIIIIIIIIVVIVVIIIVIIIIIIFLMYQRWDRLLRDNKNI